MVLTAKASSCEGGSDSLVAKSNNTKFAVWMHFRFKADGKGKPKTSDAGGLYAL